MINLVINDKDCKLFGEIFMFLPSHNLTIAKVSWYFIYCGIIFCYFYVKQINLMNFKKRFKVSV